MKNLINLFRCATNDFFLTLLYICIYMYIYIYIHIYIMLHHIMLCTHKYMQTHLRKNVTVYLLRKCLREEVLESL